MSQLTIEHIQGEMEKVELSPRQVADYRVYLAALYSLRAAEIQSILAVKPPLWLQLRVEKNSDAATDRLWETTDKGQREIQLKWELRRIEKLSNALGSKLRIMEAEARNQM